MAGWYSIDVRLAWPSQGWGKFENQGPPVKPAIQKARNAGKAVTTFVVAWSLLMGAVVVLSMLANTKLSFEWLAILGGFAAIVMGYHCWRQYRWKNSVDGIGPNASPP